MAQSEKLRALGQNASGIAHDLNQSLMLVASYSDLARQALVQDRPNLAEAEDLMATTTQAALDGGETVKRLLLFTRAATKHDTQPVDLSGLVRDAAQLTAPRWRDDAQAHCRPISLLVETEDQPTTQGSPAQLREVMTNLIFNAVDALPGGGIVEQHGGQIDVRSAPDEGTTFRINLPLIEVSGVPEPASLPRAVSTPSRPLRVLAVDDEPAMTKAAIRFLDRLM